MARAKRALGRRNISGLEDVIKTLNKKGGEIEGATLKGLIRAGILIRREAQKNTPVVTGNLRASAYVVAKGKRPPTMPVWKEENTSKMARDFSRRIGEAQALVQSMPIPYVQVGFTAFYALYVHEDPNAGSGIANKSVPIYRRKSERGGPKFLEIAVRQNIGKIIDVVAKEARKGIK